MTRVSLSARAASPATVPPRARTEPPTIDEARAVQDDLLQHARRYDFFYVVGMIERLQPESVRVGGDGPYAGEAVRFRHDPSLSFKPGDISTIRYTEKPRAAEDLLEEADHRFELTTSFLGLTGTITPMPLYMAEEIAQSQDSAAVKRDFLDIFHHRCVSFVYRIGVKYDLAREYARDGSDAWSRRLLALAGFDRYAGRKTRHLPLWRLLRLAPLLSNQVRSARTIELALQDACGEALDGATVDVLQFEGGWTALDQEQRMALGISNSNLGIQSVLGVQCYHRAGKAVIVLGPLGANFRRFLTDGDMYPVVVELLTMMSPEPIEYELDLVLEEQARPPFHLGVMEGGRVGIDSWLGSRLGAQQQTHLKVPLPAELPRDEGAFKPGWQSLPQR